MHHAKPDNPTLENVGSFGVEVGGEGVRGEKGLTELLKVWIANLMLPVIDFLYSQNIIGLGATLSSEHIALLYLPYDILAKHFFSVAIWRPRR